MAGQAVMPKGKMFPDYITYWTAGKLVASGQSLYDVDRQIEIQRAWVGPIDQWPRGARFSALLLSSLVRAGLHAARPAGVRGGQVGLVFLNLELLFLTGFVLRDAVPGVPRSIALVAVPLGLFSVEALLAGQTTILILFLAALAWRLLDGHRDRAAGAVLACLTTKPQLAAVLVLAAGHLGGPPASLGCRLWVRRDPRGALFGQQRSSAIMADGDAQRDSADVASHGDFPWLGNTWFLILRTLGLRSWSLWVLFLAVALPFLWAVVKTAIDPGRPVCDVIALGLLAAFFVAPYGRDYYFPVLCVPALVLIGDRLSEKAGGHSWSD